MKEADASLSAESMLRELQPSNLAIVCGGTLASGKIAFQMWSNSRSRDEG
jgi:hypothetical protein